MEKELNMQLEKQRAMVQVMMNDDKMENLFLI
jgi:hypothetical protein